MPDAATEASDPPTLDPARSQPTQARRPPLPPGGRRLAARWPALGEATVSLSTGIGFMLWARDIHVDPMIRIGQVSGLAVLQFRAALVALPVLAVVLYAAHRASERRHRLLLRLGCAAVAGLGTGIVAGGIAVALHGTPWGLGGQDGDPGTLQGYAASFLRGEGLPDLYPPGFIVLLAEWATYLRHGQLGYALKDLQLLVSAVFGPVCYLAWRSLLRPAWALAAALPASVLFLDPIRPYSHIVMVVLMPMIGLLFTQLRRVPALALGPVLRRGAALGAVFGLLFLTYSGWFVWTVPGVLVATPALIPWRRGRAVLLRAAALLGSTTVVAALVGSPLLLRTIQHAGTIDRYAYFDVYIDPAYVMGWRQDRPGWPPSWAWPPPGELAGQDAFTLLVIAGVVVALALGLRRPPVVAALSCLVSAWLLRFWFAGHMEQNQAVMLYPRTTWIIMYSLITLAVLGVMLLGDGARSLWARVADPAGQGGPLGRRLAAGSLCGLALFGAMGASWSANRYMPSDPAKGDMGMDAWRSHQLQRSDGSCPVYAPGGTCTAPHPLGRPQDSKDTRLWCGNVGPQDWLSFCGAKPPWE